MKTYVALQLSMMADTAGSRVSAVFAKLNSVI